MYINTSNVHRGQEQTYIGIVGPRLVIMYSKQV